MATAKAAPKTAARTAPKFAVIDDVIHYTSRAGDEITIDLDIPADALKKAMGGKDEDRDEEEQFEIIADIFGPDFQAAYDRMGALERRRLLRSFFVEFHKAAAMPLGESSGSSDS
jgi:hypothetical protein